MMIKLLGNGIFNDNYYREPSERPERSSIVRNVSLKQGFLPSNLVTSINTNFEDSLFEIDLGNEPPLLKRGEKAKGEGIDSELKRLLQNGGGRREMEKKLNENQMWEGTWDDQDGGGELRRLLSGVRPLHGRTTSRHQGWEISNLYLTLPLPPP